MALLLFDHQGTQDNWEQDQRRIHLLFDVFLFKNAKYGYNSYKHHDQPGYDSYDRRNDTSLRFSGEKGRDWVGKNDKQ